MTTSAAKKLKKTEAEPMRLSIAITELAPICKMDHFNNWPKIITKIWRKLAPEDFVICERGLRSTGHVALAHDTDMAKLRALETKHGQTGLLQRVAQLNANPGKSSADLVQGQQSAIASIGPGLAKEEQEALARLIQSTTNVRHGISHEASGVKLFEQATGQKVLTTQSSVQYEFSTTPQAVWVLNGRIDGVTESGALIEVKNRQRELFNTVRDYEMCQIQAYMHIRGASLAYLVEVLPGTPVTYNIMEVAADPAYWTNVIQPGLTRIVDFCQGPLFKTSGLRLDILRGLREPYDKVYCDEGGN